MKWNDEQLNLISVTYNSEELCISKIKILCIYNIYEQYSRAEND